jgi:nucleotide-binding universal stress UspA family protein
VTLLHVIERDAPQSIHGEQHLADERAATGYLEGVQRSLAGQGITASYHVHSNRERDVAGSIVGHAREFGNDLIVLATHGSGGLRDVIIGSIAEQVIGGGAAPVLLLRPGAGPADRRFAVHRILVPLDGSDDSELALPHAEAMARAWEAELLLARVVPTHVDLSSEHSAVAVMLPSTVRAILDFEEEAATEYLAAVRTRLGAPFPVTPWILRGDPTTMVVRAVETSAVDLVVMATHGRSGLGAFWANSVGHRLAERITVPLLIDATATRYGVRIPPLSRQPGENRSAGERHRG